MREKYFYSVISDEDKRFYSLNFLFAQSRESSDSQINKIPPIRTGERKYKGKNIIIEKYYKNISTIFQTEDDYDKE